MGNNIRIGKDFNVQWAINKVVDGERLPYDLVGKELQLYIVNDNGRKEVAGWKVRGNVIEWTFLGKDQKRLGAYQLVLVENADKDGMVTVDTCKAFNLVAHSCEEDVEGGNGIVIETVTLESDVALAPVVKEIGGESYDEIMERLEEHDQLIEDLQNMKIDREADDYYPKLAVGLADNLPGVDVVDSEINFRRSGGGAITDGVARIESIKGNSLVWNQLVNGEGSLTLSNSHKYMTIIGSVAAIKTNIATLDVAEEDRVYNLTRMFGSGNEPTTIEEFYARIPMGVDLYAYNEGEVIHMDVQSLESQGVNAWDEEWEIGGISETTGDENDMPHFRNKNYIEIIPNTQYYFKKPGGVVTYLMFYDDNKNFLKFLDPFATVGEGGAFTTPDVRYMRFVCHASPYNHDICINLSDALINGKYFPYIKRVEDLSIIRKYFPQGMKSAGSAHDEILFNKASGKWEKVVRIGVMDLGTLDYILDNRFSNPQFYVESKSDVHNSNILCSKYTAIKNGSWDTNKDKTILISATNNIIIVDSSYTDAISFKAAMSGVMLYYELAEPIVTELDEADQFKDLDYQVWNAGTEKAIAEGKSSPLAADITYGFNAIGKIKELESLVAALRAKVGI